MATDQVHLNVATGGSGWEWNHRQGRCSREELPNFNGAWCARSYDASNLSLWRSWGDRVWRLPELDQQTFPIDAPAQCGFKEPSLTQLLRTDRQAFVRMQELSREGIKPRADGTRPVDGILRNMYNDSSVMFYMLPTQQRERSRSPPKKNPEGR